MKKKDHEGAARLLLRVARNVSKFPKHMVQILTSVVIECQRAGLKAASYEYAVDLMRPEYRSALDVNIKRKIEAIVRRRSAVGESEPVEATSPCPISAQDIPDYQLECPTTKDAVPMCAVTGKHMVLSDWCLCPVSKFPVLYSEYLKFVREELASAAAESRAEASEGNLVSPKVLVDPVLGKPLNPEDIKLLPPEDALKYIQKFNNVKDESETVVASEGSGGEKSDTKAPSGEADGDKADDNDMENERVSRRRKARASEKRRGQK